MESTTATAPAARLLLDRSPAGGPPVGFAGPDRTAVVSPAFRAAGDAVWSRLLPRNLPPLADGKLPDDPQSKKALLSPRLAGVRRRKDECLLFIYFCDCGRVSVTRDRRRRGKTDFLCLLPW